jgi:hypothetical protein
MCSSRSDGDGDSDNTATTPADIVDDLGGVTPTLGCTASRPVAAGLHANERLHDRVSISLRLRMNACAGI